MLHSGACKAEAEDLKIIGEDTARLIRFTCSRSIIVVGSKDMYLQL